MNENESEIKITDFNETKETTEFINHEKTDDSIPINISSVS